jgi:hypothetical protein
MKHTVEVSTEASDSSIPSSQERGILFDLQLRVARRSDALARGCISSRTFDRRLWLRAEQEIFENVQRTEAHFGFRLAAAAAAEFGICRAGLPAALTACRDGARRALAEGRLEIFGGPPSLNCHESDRWVTQR